MSAEMNGRPETNPGRRLPAGTLVAAGSERRLDLHALPAPALLVCHTEKSSDAVAVVSEHVRATLPDPATLLIISCVDLHHVPKMFRPLANKAMANAYRQTLKLIPADLDPVDHVIITPDWEGTIRGALEFEEVDSEAGVGLVAPDGTILGTARRVTDIDALLAALA